MQAQQRQAGRRQVAVKSMLPETLLRPVCQPAGSGYSSAAAQLV